MPGPVEKTSTSLPAWRGSVLSLPAGLFYKADLRVDHPVLAPVRAHQGDPRDLHPRPGDRNRRKSPPGNGLAQEGNVGRKPFPVKGDPIVPQGPAQTPDIGRQLLRADLVPKADGPALELPQPPGRGDAGERLQRFHLPEGVLRDADDIFIRGLRAYDCSGMGFPSASDPRVMATNLYDAIWQAGVILLPVKSVGVMGDERTYENPVALRAVVSTDAMTADWFPLPYDFLSAVSNEIINKVRGVNRVVYDVSSKPPATIEWE